MLNMWNLSNPIRAEQSQTSIEVSRLNLSCSADDPNNPENRLGVSEIRNRISRPHSCMSDRGPGRSRPAKESEGSTKSLRLAYAVVSSDQNLPDKVAAQLRAYHSA